jgi:hypothetical protein
MLPFGMEPPRLLVLGLDQGSIGTAGLAFAGSKMGLCIHGRFCKFHRIVRDMRLAVSHSSQALFLKAQILSNYLWCVNKRPFGTGLFTEQKHRCLESFLETQTRHDPLFQRYGHLIAKDLGLRYESDHDQQQVWNALSTLSTFQQAGEALRIKYASLFGLGCFPFAFLSSLMHNLAQSCARPIPKLRPSGLCNLAQICARPSQRLPAPTGMQRERLTVIRKHRAGPIECAAGCSKEVRTGTQRSCIVSHTIAPMGRRLSLRVVVFRLCASTRRFRRLSVPLVARRKSEQGLREVALSHTPLLQWGGGLACVW